MLTSKLDEGSRKNRGLGGWINSGITLQTRILRWLSLRDRLLDRNRRLPLNLKCCGSYRAVAVLTEKCVMTLPASINFAELLRGT